MVNTTVTVSSNQVKHQVQTRETEQRDTGTPCGKHKLPSRQTKSNTKSKHGKQNEETLGHRVVNTTVTVSSNQVKHQVQTRETERRDTGTPCGKHNSYRLVKPSQTPSPNTGNRTRRHFAQCNLEALSSRIRHLVSGNVITARKRSCGKVMFLHLSVVQFTGGVMMSLPVMDSTTPSPQDGTPSRQHPSRKASPPGRYTPRRQQAGGTHPTGNAFLF